MSKTIIAVRHFGLGGRESLETAVIYLIVPYYIRGNLNFPIVVRFNIDQRVYLSIRTNILYAGKKR